MISQASKSIAAGIFTTGLLLVGFGLLIYLLPRLFATLAAAVFLVIGIGCITTAVKIFITQKNLDKFNQDDSATYRKNVRIRNGRDEFFDF
jgi:hypothetical protein